MTVGQNAATDPVEQFLEPTKDLLRRIGDLERKLGKRGPALGRRNLLHNGQHAVCQRYSSAATVALPNSSAQTFTADRWGNVNNRATGTIVAVYTDYSAYAIAPPVGRPRPAKILRMEVTVAGGALGANDYVLWRQGIEGVNLQHLDWGTSRAKPLTLSFDCWSSAGGTFVYELYNSANGRATSKAFTVPAGVTTTVVLNFPGDTGGTGFANTPADALAVQCFVAAGSTFSSAGAYTTNDWNTPTGSRASGISTNFGTVVGHTLVITNAQLEAGTVATPFEVLQYADELQQCERYFQWIAKPDVSQEFIGFCYVASNAYASVQFRPEMRAAPACTFWGTWIGQDAGNVGRGVTTMDAADISPRRALIRGFGIFNLVAGNATMLYNPINTGGAWASAEI